MIESIRKEKKEIEKTIMAKVYTNTANIGGDYTGTVTVSGPVLLGENITSDGNNIPVVVTGNGTSASSIAPFSFVGGQLARSESSLSFVWNGSDFQDGDPNKSSYGDNNPYLGANQKGTFSINPNGNLDGIFIGSKSLKTHMGELSGFVADTLSSSSFSQDNNIVHKTGTETVSGVKTFTSSIAVGSSNNNKVVIDNSSIRINSDGNGGILFHFNGNSTPTASLKETESGTLMFGSKLNVSGDSTFESENNKFNGISLSEGKTASFVSGKVYVSTVSSNNKSSLAASTEYVDNAIANIQSDAILDLDGTYTGHNKFGGETTFANNISLSSKYNTDDTPVDVNFVNGNLYVADQSGANSSSLAANTKFVKDIAASLSASLRGNKNTIGSGVVPIYLAGTSSLNASLVQSTSNVGNETQHIYLKGGSLTQSSITVGGINRPVYLSSGAVTQCNEFVTTSTAQDISGVKSFTTQQWFANAPKVYSNAEKGNVNSYNKYAYVDFCLSSLHSNFNPSSMRIGLVGSAIHSSGAYTQSYLAAYANKMNDATNAQIGVRISPDGKEKYAFGVHPTDADGNRLNTTSTLNGVIPTIGWTNAYYARKDGADFTGNVTVGGILKASGPVELFSASAPHINFHYANSSADYTSRIIAETAGQLRIIPCTNSLEGTASDTAASIRLGTQTIGSTAKPVYVNGGRLSALTSTVGSTSKPVYLNSGTITELSSTVGSISKPAYLSAGTITALSATKGSTSKPVYLNAGDITELSATVGGNNAPVYLNSGTITKCSSTVGSANQPVYMSTGNITACNTMVATTGDQTISGVKTFSSRAWIPALEMSADTPYIDFHYNKSTTDYTQRIISDGDNHLSINVGSVNTAASIRLGTSTIGSKMSPVYVNGGHITECGNKICGSFTLCGHTNYVYMKASQIIVPNSNPSSIHIVVRNDGNATSVLINGSSVGIGASGGYYSSLFSYAAYGSTNALYRLGSSTHLYMNITVF